MILQITLGNCFSPFAQRNGADPAGRLSAGQAARLRKKSMDLHH
jgi:hypothetical protein